MIDNVNIPLLSIRYCCSSSNNIVSHIQSTAAYFSWHPITSLENSYCHSMPRKHDNVNHEKT